MAASDQTTISNLDELTSPAAADKLIIDDASTNTTKYIRADTLLGPAHGALTNSSVDQGGSVITIATDTTYDDIAGYSSEGEASNTTISTTNGTITLPAGVGTYWVFYNAGAAQTTGGTKDIYIHAVADGTHIQGTESYVSGSGSSGDAHSQSASVLYRASGGEVLKLQTKLGSGSGNVEIDNINFGVIFVSL